MTRNLLALTRTLALLRFDVGPEGRLAPSAGAKLLFTLATVLLVSLARNQLFVALVCAFLLVRAALLPRAALARLMGASVAAAALAGLTLLPAVLLGQPRSAATLAGKAFVCTGLVLLLALTTPPAQIGGAARRLGVPAVAILSFDLALASIVRLGETAAEVLCALRLRSVGRNHRKGASFGGVGGVVLVKASRAAQDTYDAMRCRGFDGSYRSVRGTGWRRADLLLLALLAGLVALFVHLQGAL